ncbi:MAG: YceI family protein [Frankiales bacterium]|nr:YceI family protein [Frankiales bacterium]
MTSPTPGPESSVLLAASVGSWHLDAARTTVELQTKAMWGLAKVTATFKAIEGWALVGPDGEVSGTLVIDAASVDTRQAKRDAHLLTKDFFEVEAYPTFTYTATSATLGADGTLRIAGTFTAHGQTHPLEVRATVAADGADSVSVTGRAELDRSQWGLTWTKMGARLHNQVLVTAVFSRE